MLTVHIFSIIYIEVRMLPLSVMRAPHYVKEAEFDNSHSFRSGRMDSRWSKYLGYGTAPKIY